MSQKNLEIVRRAADGINRGDIRLAMEEAADDFEMDWSNSIGPLSGVYRGREQVRQVWETFLEAWEELQWNVQEATDLDGERVLIVNRVQMRGRASHLNVEATGVQVWTVRNDQISSVKIFQSKAEALEALNLER